ncbi:hypothetical protein Y032_1312g3820, partial [Ancylostoma ceylanicum]
MLVVSCALLLGCREMIETLHQKFFLASFPHELCPGF